MFARNRKALEHFCRHVTLGGDPFWEQVSGLLAQLLLDASPEEEKLFNGMRIRESNLAGRSLDIVFEYFANSGWQDFLQELSLRTRKDVVISSYDSHSRASCPVFRRGRIYELILRDGESPDYAKFSVLEHACMPKLELFVQERFTHFLIPHIPGGFISYGDATPRDQSGATPEQIVVLVQEALGFMRFLYDNGYVIDKNALYAYGGELGTKDVLHVLYIPEISAGRVNIATGYFRQIYSLRVGLEFYFPQDDTEKPTPTELKLKELYSWGGDVDVKYSVGVCHPEYKLPAIAPALAQKYDSWMPHIKYQNEYNWGGVFTQLEMLAALLSKGIEPSLSNDITDTFLNNLGLYGYARTPLNFYTTVTRFDPFPSLSQYQAAYDVAAAGKERHPENIVSYEFETQPREVDIYQPVYRSRDILIKRYGPDSAILKRSWSPERWIQEELPLDITEDEDRPDLMNVHGVELNTEDVMYVFYNTPLGKAVEDSLVEYNPQWLSAADALLMSEFLNGQVMPFTFCSELSETAYIVLSGSRTFLDLYDHPVARVLIDMVFQLGVPFREQLRGAREEILTRADAYKLSRMRELASR